jgi:ATP-binding cassette, subfamily B, multidrug efflux pump
MSTMNFDSDSDSLDRLSGGFSVFALLKRLGKYFAPERAACVAVSSLVVVNALIGRAIVILFGLAIDRGLIAKNHEFLMWAAAGYFILEVFMMTMQAGISTWFSRIGNRVLYRLRDHLVAHVQSLPASYFDRVPSGRIVTRLTSDTVSLTELFNQGLLSVFSSVISILAIVAAMSVISIKMTAYTLLIAPPMIYVAFRLSDRILIAQRIAKKHVSTINAFVAESVSGIRVIQLFNQILPQRERFRGLSKTYKDANLHAVSLYALFYPTVSLFTAISVATALYIGGDLTFAGFTQAGDLAPGVLTTGAMITFIFHVKDFGDPLRNILERYQLFQNSVSSGERIFALLEETPESRPMVPQPLEKPVAGRLAFEDVTFSYAANLSPALKNVSFELPAGSTLAVVGRTGSGKSTLISLLQRFRDPIAGQIRLDGVDLAQLDRREVRRAIGVVQQDVFLFRGTIADNISLADPKIGRERVEWAAVEAGLARLVRMRPGGLDAVVEERGANLSLGERQLIAFARILAFDPQILVLDEATASVDSETEHLLQMATNRARKNRTSIIIAHRLSTVLDADKVIVLRLGEIIEMGAPADLLKQDGVFREMADAQKTAQKFAQTNSSQEPV